MKAKERFRQVVAEMSDEEAAQVLAWVEAARSSASPVDIYGTP